MTTIALSLTRPELISTVTTLVGGAAGVGLHKLAGKYKFRLTRTEVADAKAVLKAVETIDPKAVAQAKAAEANVESAVAKAAPAVAPELVAAAHAAVDAVVKAARASEPAGDVPGPRNDFGVVVTTGPAEPATTPNLP